MPYADPAKQHATRIKRSPRRDAPEYKAWDAMIQRCTNSSNIGYFRYGGRGISVCDAWRQSYERFFADVGPRPGQTYSLDRIDNSRGYEPGNVRWATPAEQSRNKRTTRLISAMGKTMTLADWSKETGMAVTTILGRIDKLGWPADEAMTLRAFKGNRRG